MADLKIKILAAIPIEDNKEFDGVNTVRFGHRVASKISNNYNEAKTSFETHDLSFRTLTYSVKLYSTATSEADIKASADANIHIYHLRVSNPANISKIISTVTKNTYNILDLTLKHRITGGVPNGGLEDIQYSKGIGGEFSESERTTPLNNSLSNIEKNISTFTEGMVFTFYIKLYPLIKRTDGVFQPSAVVLETAITFKDQNNNNISFKRYRPSTGGEYTVLGTYSTLNHNILVNYIPFVDVFPISEASMIINDISSALINDTKTFYTGLQIVTLPPHGTLKLNGNNVAVNDFIPMEDILANKFVYHRTNTPDSSFSFYLSNWTSGATSWGRFEGTMTFVSNAAPF